MRHWTFLDPHAQVLGVLVSRRQQPESKSLNQTKRLYSSELKQQYLDKNHAVPQNYLNEQLLPCNPVLNVLFPFRLTSTFL